MGFSINKTIDLSPFGWEGCSIVVKSMTYGELKDFQTIDPTNPQIGDADRVVKFIQSKFVSGTALDDTGKKIDLKSSDIPKLPLEVYLHLQDQLVGVKTDPNL